MSHIATNQRNAMITALIACIINVISVGLILNCLYYGLILIHRGTPPINSYHFFESLAHVLGPIICMIMGGIVTYREFRKHPKMPPTHGISIWIWITVYVHIAHAYLSPPSQFSYLARTVIFIGIGLSVALSIYLAQRKNKCRPFGLSQRELEIAKHVKEGLSNKVIADTLFISEYTVKNHLKNIFQKTGASNRTELSQQI
ncbi:response regulator transcription factor [bacterium]|jgi:DNA-binding CsgD family transcriptional regulator|nr:response regulator transcription factor [bacterium]